jgi:uncharacterized protein (DUF849 family)
VTGVQTCALPIYTFYLPDGGQATDNGQLVEALVRIARQAGREPATPAEARQMLGLERRTA